jgi:hypothetical protein
MKRGGVLAFLLLAVALVALVAMVQQAQRPSAVNFLFTADTQGFLVPCGCKTVPAGGLARRVAALDAFVEECRPGVVVPVEVAHGFADRGPARDLLNAEMGRYFKETGTLVGLGSYDLLLGPEALRMAAPGVDLFAAGREAYPGGKTFRLGGGALGPFSWGGKTLRLVFLSQSAPGGAPMADPLAVLARDLREHPADKLVVVGQLAPDTVRNLLKVEPSVLLVVAQWGTSVTGLPQDAGSGRWVIYMGDRGRRVATARVAFSSGTWQILPQTRYLGPDEPSDTAMATRVAETLKAVSAANADALERTVRDPGPSPAFVGAVACKSCHAEAYRVWSLSPHARATKDLAIDHQERNPECLTCHATGLGRPGGYPNGSPDLSGVQCEACHGPGHGHPPRKLTVGTPGSETCGPCHTPRDSPAFQPEGFLKLIEHR